MQNTFPSLNSLKLNPYRPTLICDADQVIFDFMYDFQNFLKIKKLFFNWKSYALTSNILKNDNSSLNEEEIKELINNFFKKFTLKMTVIRGSIKTLNKISKYFNIVVLSNIPFEYYDLRLNALNNNNLNFPFFANKGEKGTASSHIFNFNKNQTWFIDDSPFQVSSVIKKEPNIKTILFIENTKLAKLIKNKNNCDFYSTSWLKNEKILLNQFLKYD
ncbi:MAG: hypothetical protein CFH34_00800 [Alphaproteobacteria bacterium MarineAlpha9_Bin4]|nr:hypothetical protein [Pelagibacterales bacterium]PPR26683.1 MAG: hypothetical protein CFH34_00800 [Alphaproteobacteria bacterium MarineAlpha9_Bin4]